MSEEGEPKIALTETTKTISTAIHPQFATSEYQLLLTIPRHRPTTTSTKNKQTVPITVHLSTTGPSAALGCFVYSIIDLRDKSQTQQKAQSQIYQTLLNNAEEALVDLTKRLGFLITKKFKVPSYVSISGDGVSIEDFVSLVGDLNKVIDESFD
ncbi:unnamed protein product [Ambrosiozyma monospora]|uniref:Unnamed protein product n=1 Tax=Ambrosiozyma monospora TaxID=43982 RepID=A0A9W6Z3E0_AMBMO|nr:unnamed protein product [Ambrosiozyma monospora]